MSDDEKLCVIINIYCKDVTLCPHRMNRPSLTYGEAVQYGMENVSWLRRHSNWGK